MSPQGPATGLKVFLEWLASSNSSAATAYLSFLQRPGADTQTPSAGLLVTNLVNSWHAYEAETRRFKVTTLKAYHKCVKSTLIAMGQHFPQVHPRISGKSLQFTFKVEAASRPSVGELDWPEFADVPVEKRDALAIRMIRAEAVRLFNIQEAIFVSGQSVLLGAHPPAGCSKKHWKALKVAIQCEQAHRLKTGGSIFGCIWSARFKEAAQTLFEDGALVKAGFPLGVGPDKVDNLTITPLLSACLGATLPLTIAMQTIFYVETGWNKQTVHDLAADPFLYKSDLGVRLATEQQIQAFKGRAGHHVLADIEAGKVLRGIADANCQAIWDEVAECNKFAGGDGIAFVSNDNDFLDLINRYRRIVEETRRYLRPTDRQDSFFLSLVMRRGLNITVGGINTSRSPLTLMAREGVSSVSIRQSYAKISRQAGSTTAEVRARLGHSASGTTVRHYSMSPNAIRDYKASIRFFQGCLQSLLIDGRTAAKFAFSTDDHEWFRQLAHISGIASACGVTGSLVTEESRPDFLFSPDEDSLLELYLSLRALSLTKRKVSSLRWETQGVPLVGMMVAVVRWITDKGYGAAYRNACHVGKNLLLAGKVRLPVTLEA